ncbi:DUF1120 domain-containing protein [Bordetella sp. 15P40C-2]|uniref:DUF1120 domain-containing protein n=1 Tax=Bordetella sp. 15P40C-2 TaxID=2572246 RepID=UPI001325753A|nr:DUF1120 domain-containing protein [Bordetella sp. 15P40C-2]MVW70700.1 DUF1120 domain-containing protein [Bordetella sp. 15P40C-2]
MKRTLISLCLAAASLAPVLATANSSAQLQVTGTIKPEACNISSSLAVADLGETPFSKLKPNAKTSLDKPGGVKFTLSLTCSDKTMLGVRAIDNRAGTASYLDWDTKYQKRLFGLGSVAGVPLGSYWLVSDAGDVADGEPADLGTCSKETADCDHADDVLPNQLKVLLNASSGDRPLSFKSATLNFEVYNAYVRDSDSLPKGRRVKLDGSTTFELVYL